MLTIVIGTDWITNRDIILQKIAEDVAAEKVGRVFIVPELISHDTERRLCMAAGDSCSRFAEVLSFSRLAKRVSEYDGRALVPCMDQGGRLVAMASATKQIYSRLKSYASVETKPEFFSGLIDAVDEFKRCCISSADLMDASMQTEGSLAQKLEELSLILESYNSVCARGKCDPRDQMTWLLEELEDSSYGVDHAFYIDGFPDYTRQHLNIIKHLIGTSADVTVGLVCDRVGSEDASFAKAGETALLLLQMAEQLGVPAKIEQYKPETKATEVVGKYLFGGNVTDEHCGTLQAIRTQTPYQECETAVEMVLQYVSEGARYRDINIACADMATYQNMLEMLFEKCDIPLYISGTDSVINQPAIHTVLSALEVVQSGFELDDVLQYLKSMVSPLDADICDQVENYAIMWGITGSKWTQEWHNHPDGLDGRWTESTKMRLAALNTARKQTVDPLVKLRKAFDESRN